MLQNRFIISFLLIFCTSTPTIAENLISIQSGGKAIHWTSEKHPFIARNIIDNNKSSYWVSSGNILPHVLTFALPSNQRFESLSFISKTNDWYLSSLIPEIITEPSPADLIKIKKEIIPNVALHVCYCTIPLKIMV